MLPISSKKRKALFNMLLVSFFMFGFIQIQAQQKTNDPERVKWFQDLGFGMFIHWNVDASLGAVISHSLSGASNEYADKYFNSLPVWDGTTDYIAALAATVTTTNDALWQKCFKKWT